MNARPEQPEPFLRGCLFGPVADIPYPRANPSDAERLPVDVWAAAQVPAGIRLELIGDAQAVQISYETTTGNLGYRGEGAGCTFSLYRHAQKLDEVEAVLGQGIVELELSGDADRPALVYLPEGMRPLVHSITPIGGLIQPAPTQARWLAYGDAATQGWLASSPAMSWPSVAGRKLGFDVVNMGFAGSIRGDTALAEMLADTPAEAISVQFGSNCWSRVPHTPELIAEEIRAFVTLVRGDQPEVPIVMISPTLRPDAEEKPNRLGATLADLRIAMEEAVRERMAGGDARLFLVEGARVLEADDLEDGVYPGDEGHKRLAAAVNKFLSPLVNELREAALARWREEGTLYAESGPAPVPSQSLSQSSGVNALSIDPEAQAVVDNVFAGDLVPSEPAASERVFVHLPSDDDVEEAPATVPAVGSSAVGSSAVGSSVAGSSAAGSSVGAAVESAETEPVQTRIRVKIPQDLADQLESEKQQRIQPAAGVKFQESTRFVSSSPQAARFDAVEAGGGGFETHPALAGGEQVGAGMETQPLYAGDTSEPVYASDSADRPQS